MSAGVMMLVREVRQSSILVVHIVGWGGRSASTTGGSPLQDYMEWWLLRPQLYPSWQHGPHTGREQPHAEQ